MERTRLAQLLNIKKGDYNVVITRIITNLVHFLEKHAVFRMVRALRECGLLRQSRADDTERTEAVCHLRLPRAASADGTVHQHRVWIERRPQRFIDNKE